MASFIRIYCFIRRRQLQIHAQQQAVQSSDAGKKLKRTAIEHLNEHFCLLYSLDYMLSSILCCIVS